MLLAPRKVTTAEWLDRIGWFRVEVWQANTMVDAASFPDGKCLEPVDSIATHFVIEQGGELLGACRYAQYPDLASSHHSQYYLAAGIRLQGPVGIPEHTVVRPDYARQGLGSRLASAQLQEAIAHNARYMLIEAAPAAAAMLRKRGRKYLGKAPPDPRFPNVQFEWFVTDMAQLREPR